MKGKRTNLENAECGIARSLQVIGDWWSLLIIREAFQGKERFGEFQKTIGLAKNILSSRLKKLVEQGIFRIEADEGNAVSHRYVLTEKGHELYIVLIALWQWGESTCFQPGESRYHVVDRRSGEQIARLELKTEHGRDVGPRDFRIAKLATAEEASV
ncbi:transcriptional regulator, HxlR family [Sphingobium chlorophenolicum L-1]|uniref:Transcriptional regulator, HxlR family n=2 Tax=Sphingobium chlorophenolicum TaxID=46429 RepID=F6F3P3_SPHCR|nr:helix-turn-helix domain-containing protein [Sphingobium chlorophenolicum]AEG51055.1 transcriptional regulator, HxlR family [Sphingobium chlorophenolicum L-1]KEQ52337.1 Transcriptional regulator, HxlR family [Sphingobium chlorophenolicum]